MSSTFWYYLFRHYVLFGIVFIYLFVYDCFQSISLGADDDEDINTLTTIIPSIEIVGPITQSRAQHLNHQINLFLCSSTYNIESRLLPNNLIVLRNQGEDHGG
jgi:hypothetical protein